MIVHWWRAWRLRRFEEQLWAIAFPPAHAELDRRLMALRGLADETRAAMIAHEITELRTMIGQQAAEISWWDRRRFLRHFPRVAPTMGAQLAENAAARYEGRPPVNLWPTPPSPFGRS